METRDRLKPTLVLLALIGIDSVFLVLHLLYLYTPVLDNPRYSIELDRGFSEFYQYGKELYAIVILALLYGRRKSQLFLCWIFLFFFLLADDSLQIHEHGGAWIAQALGLTPQFRLRGEDFGELAIAGLVFGVFAIAMAIAWMRSEWADRGTSLILFVLVGGLVGFGVGFDMLHIAFWNTLLRPFLGIIEDGGEMLMMSAIIWYLYRKSTLTEPVLPLVTAER